VARQRKRFDGQVVLLRSASVIRFILEFWRGDPGRGSLFGGALSTSQVIGIVLVLGAAVLWPRLSRKGTPVPATA
jgi:prolipoprotein diacylglyceryltransferase